MDHHHPVVRRVAGQPAGADHGHEVPRAAHQRDACDVEDDRLAFVRADFTVVIDGQVRSHGVDYFTLVKDGDAWKILNGAYTSHTGAPKTSR